MMWWATFWPSLTPVLKNHQWSFPAVRTQGDPSLVLSYLCSRFHLSPSRAAETQRRRNTNLALETWLLGNLHWWWAEPVQMFLLFKDIICGIPSLYGYVVVGKHLAEDMNKSQKASSKSVIVEVGVLGEKYLHCSSFCDQVQGYLSLES